MPARIGARRMEAAHARLRSGGLAIAGLDLDFVRGRYALNSPYRTSPADLPGWSFSRTGAGIAETAAGALVSFAAGVPRITDRGLLVEEGRTETAGNNSFAGVSPGLLTPGVPFGSGGFLVISHAAGLTATVIGTGQTDGIPWVDIRIQGTPSTSPHFSLDYQTGALAPAASVGQVWMNSVYLALVGGTFANVAGIALRALERAANNSIIGTVNTANIQSQVGSTLRRLSAQNAIVTAGTAKANGLVALSGSGAAVDYTLRIGLPSFQLGASLNSPIITAGSPATRGLDVADQALPLAPDEDVTLYAEVDFTAAPSNIERIAEWHNGTNAVGVLLFRNASSQLACNIRNGGEAVVGAGNPTSGVTRARLVASRTGSVYSFASNGAIIGKLTSPGMGALNLLRIGDTPFAAQRNVNDYVRNVRVLRQGCSDDDLRALTSPANDWTDLSSYLASLDDALMLDFADPDWMRTTPTGPTQPALANDNIGLALSRRLAGQNDLLSRYLAGQPELVVNGGFDTDLAAWSQANTGASNWTWDNGVARANTNGVDNARLRQVVPVTAGRSYLVNYSGEPISVSVGTSPGGVEMLAFGGRNRVFTATTNTAHLNFVTNGNGALLDNVTVKEVSRAAATQSFANLQPRWQGYGGARFDGLDDVLLTGYRAGAGANFIVAKARIQAAVSGNPVVALAGLRTNAGGRLFLGIRQTGGTVGGGVGGQNQDTIFGGQSILGREVVVGITQDGTTVRLFADGQQVYSGPQSGAVDTTVPLMVGGINTEGTAGFFTSSDVSRLVAGRDFLDLARFRQIASQL